MLTVPFFLLMKGFVVKRNKWHGCEKTHRLKHKKPAAAPVGCLMPCAGLLWWLVSCFHSLTATQSWTAVSVGSESLKSQKVLHLAHKSWHVAVAQAVFQRNNEFAVNNRLCHVRYSFTTFFPWKPRLIKITWNANTKHVMGHMSVTNVPHFLQISSGT